MTFLHPALPLLLVASSTAAAATDSELVSGSLASDLVPGPVEYYAVTPPGYDASGSIPLVLNLHGGGGSREVLRRQKPMLDELWQAGELRPMVVVTPSVTQRGFYMDFRDGSERWETFLMTEFLPHLRKTFGVRGDADGTLVTGISMGGMGSLRLAFRHPDQFAAVAAMEPGIAPILEWSEMRPKHRFWRSEDLMRTIYGDPAREGAIDGAYWTETHPTQIAVRNRDAIVASGLRIFLEAGDEDLFWLYEGAEFLHQILWREKIRHEYRLHLGADHVGATMGPRTREAFRFLDATFDDEVDDPAVTRVRRTIDRLKGRLDEADHYGVDAGKVRSPP